MSGSLINDAQGCGVAVSCIDRSVFPVGPTISRQFSALGCGDTLTAMWTYAMTDPDLEASRAVVLDVSERWSKVRCIVLSACLHAAVAGLLLIDFPDDLLSLGGGGGSSGVGDLGESVVMVIPMPPAVPLSMTHEEDSLRTPAPAVSALVTIEEPRAEIVPVPPRDQENLDSEPTTPSTRGLRYVETHVQLQERTPGPVTAVPSSQTTTELPAAEHAFETPGPDKPRAAPAEHAFEIADITEPVVPELKAAELTKSEPPADVVAQHEPLQQQELAASEMLQDLETRDIEVRPTELTMNEAELLTQVGTAPSNRDSPAVPEVPLDLNQAKPEQSPISPVVEPMQLRRDDRVSPSERELPVAIVETRLDVMEPFIQEQYPFGLEVPASKPDRQVVMPKVEQDLPMKRDVVKASTQQKQASVIETEPNPIQQADKVQTASVLEVAKDGESERANGDQLAKRPGASGQGSAGIGSGHSGSALGNYAGQLSGWLEQHKRYPMPSRRRGEEGVVTLQFTLNSRGLVVARRILVSSGHKRLDQEVLALLDRASPMPRPPGGATRFSLTIPVVFSLR